MRLGLLDLLLLIGRAGGATHPLEGLHQGLGLAQEVLPLPAAGRDHEEPGLVESGGWTVAVDGEELPVDELRFRIAPLAEEQLAVLLEHPESRLASETAGELLAGGFRLAHAPVDDDEVAPRLARQLDLVGLALLHRVGGIAAQADRDHLLQQIHRVVEGALVEPAPSGLVERVRIDVVRLHLRGGLVLG